LPYGEELLVAPRSFFHIWRWDLKKTHLPETLRHWHRHFQ
jgi:hypothetical protein